MIVSRGFMEKPGELLHVIFEKKSGKILEKSPLFKVNSAKLMVNRRAIRCPPDGGAPSSSYAGNEGCADPIVDFLGDHLWAAGGATAIPGEKPVRGPLCACVRGPPG
jgi:hypothetical protein